MARVIADSDIIIDFLRGSTADKRFEALLQSGSVGTTVINAFEILSGAKSKKTKEAIKALLNIMDIYSFDVKAVQEAVTIRPDLERLGKPIGMADYLIAGICIANDLKLYTRNKKHFEAIKHLVLV